MIKEFCDPIGQTHSAHTQPKVVIWNATFPWYLSLSKKLRYQLILLRDINDQRILQSDWIRGTSGLIQPKMIVSDVTYLDDYLHAKNLNQ